MSRGLPFVWSVPAEEVKSRARAVALVSGGRSVLQTQEQGAPAAIDEGECSFFVESSRGRVVVQLLAEMDESRVFLSLDFDLSRPGMAEALRTLAAQEVLSVHGLSPDGAPIGTAQAPLGVARRAWLASAIDRASRGASST